MYISAETSALHTPQRVHQVLNDPRRLNVLSVIALMDTPKEPTFDRLTRLASRLIGAPVSLVALIDHDRAFFKSSFGLPESTRQMPMSHSVCKHVVVGHQPLVVSDARTVDFLRENAAVTDMGIVGYLGIPLMTSDGHALGSFCVIDTVVREWTDDDIAVMKDLADTTMALLEMRAQLYTLKSQTETKMRGLMAQMVQAEIKRKETVNAQKQTLSHLMGLIEEYAPDRDILALVGSKVL